jgi:hypothetical protein
MGYSEEAEVYRKSRSCCAKDSSSSKHPTKPFRASIFSADKGPVEDALDVATLFISYAEIVQVPRLNWCLTDQSAVRYDYERMIFHFFDQPLSGLEDDADPLFSLAYGDENFQDFYDFLVRVVPEMQRKTDLGKDVQITKR